MERISGSIWKCAARQRSKNSIPTCAPSGWNVVVISANSRLADGKGMMLAKRLRQTMSLQKKLNYFIYTILGQLRKRK